MAKFDLELKMIVRPLITIEASSREEAIEKAENGEFDQKLAAQMGCPAGLIEIDNCYPSDGNPATKESALPIADVVGRSELLKAFCLHGGIQVMVPTKAQNLDELIDDFLESL